MLFNEDTFEQAIIELFENMDYTHIYAPDMNRTDYSRPLLDDALRDCLVRLNRSLPAVAIDEAILKLNDFDAGSLLQKNIAALRDGLIETEARRIVREMKRHYEPNSPNKTHFMVELSPAFMQLAATKDTDRLFSMLPYKTLSFSKIEGRHGTYALIGKGENRDREIRKPRPSVRAQLKTDKAKTAPKKAAAKTKNHDLEV